MNKTSLILKHFQKKGLLTIKNPQYAKTVLSLFNWLIESDRVQNDQTSKLLFKDKKAAAKIISHDEAVTAGIEEVNFLLKNHTSLIFKSFRKDKEKIKKEEVLAEISGNIQEILAYERTILNILQRLSGIATETKKLTKDLELRIKNIYIAATRKTPWGLLDKKAVSLGGGLTHRLSLADGILIKDNHLAFIKDFYKLKTDTQTITKALEISLKDTSVEESTNSSEKLIEIEVETEEQVYTAIKAFKKAKGKNYLAILFDNFSPSRLSTLLSHLSNLPFPIIFEASGGITKDNILSYAQTGVDIISLGSLTHSCKASNFSLSFL